jgi:hypothetical protein
MAYSISGLLFYKTLKEKFFQKNNIIFLFDEDIGTLRKKAHNKILRIFDDFNITNIKENYKDQR